MLVRLSLSSLSDGRWYEYIVRFLLGGTATAITGLIGTRWGPGVGGLFLAFPAMLCASATLVEAHERRRKREAGLKGKRRGEDAAALDAAGAALGSIGLVAFALTVLLGNTAAAWSSLVLASLAWAATAGSCWWTYKRLRRTWA
jgi:hypothetical protein